MTLISLDALGCPLVIGEDSLFRTECENLHRASLLYNCFT